MINPFVNKKEARLATVFGVILLVVIVSSITRVLDNFKELKSDLARATLLHSLDKKAMDGRLRSSYSDGFIDGLASAEEIAKEEAERLLVKPEVTLTKDQAKLCLAIGIYTEANGELPKNMLDVAWTIINRLEDKRDDTIFRNSICGIISARDGSQYSGVKPYLDIVKGIVWGDITYFDPSNGIPADYDAWMTIIAMADDIIEGRLPRSTIANHYIAPYELKGNKFPSWVKAFKPLKGSGRHLLFVDYVYKDGKQIIFTKETPYNPKLHD